MTATLIEDDDQDVEAEFALLLARRALRRARKLDPYAYLQVWGRIAELLDVEVPITAEQLRHEDRHGVPTQRHPFGDTDPESSWHVLQGRTGRARGEADVEPIGVANIPIPPLDGLSDEQRDDLRAALLADLKFNWAVLARREQLEPADYKIWLYLAGRAAGKTRAMAETVRGWLETPGTKVACIGRTFGEVRAVCFEGRKSGLLNVIPKDEQAGFNRSTLELTLKNGSTVKGFSAQDGDKVRGDEFDGIWGDEYAAWPKDQAWYMFEQAFLTLRGSRQRFILSTTPKNLPHVRALLDRAREKGDTVITRGSTFDNERNLPEGVTQGFRDMYEGTRTGLQELYAEILDDVEGAFWEAEWLHAAQWLGEKEWQDSPDFDPEEEPPLPMFKEVIVSVDPSGSPTGDDTGIVAMAKDFRDWIFVLWNSSTKGTADFRYAQVCRLAHRVGASKILYEPAYGADNCKLGIEQTWAHLATLGEVGPKCPPVEPSKAKGGKAERALPVSAEYQKQANSGREKVFHVKATHHNGIAALENELLTWEEKSKWSPNALDAMVHGFLYLMDRGGPTSISSPVGLRLDW